MVRPKEVEVIEGEKPDADNLIQVLDMNGDSEPRKPTISASDSFSPKPLDGQLFDFSADGKPHEVKCNADLPVNTPPRFLFNRQNNYIISPLVDLDRSNI